VADVVAGYTVAILPILGQFSWTRVGLLAGTSAGLYLFGMVENDLADVRRDRLLRVPRPLVTGEINVAAAVALLILTGGLAAVCAARLLGGALVLAILTFGAINLYNFGAKRGPSYVAMGVMGLCRLLNFGIGVAAAVGVPQPVGADLFLPSGPLWVRQGLALFFATAVVTGYSISARADYTVSTRPWQAMFVAAVVGGFGMIALSTALYPPAEGGVRFVAPVARVFAAMLLPALWPGGLWSAAGPQRRPEEYAPFTERALYWLIAMDAAFVLDGMLVR
jgi:4-hydroxybenzoate polyprenyltransferase